MTEADIGWTAGIVDGEGSIGAYGQPRPDRSGKIWNLRVTIGNTDIRILHRLQEFWGGKIKIQKCRNPERHNQAWQWVICGQEACEFLRSIRASLVSKGEQADLALEFGQLLNVGRSTSKVGEENLRQREDIAQRLTLVKNRKVG